MFIPGLKFKTWLVSETTAADCHRSMCLIWPSVQVNSQTSKIPNFEPGFNATHNTRDPRPILNTLRSPSLNHIPLIKDSREQN